MLESTKERNYSKELSRFNEMREIFELRYVLAVRSGRTEMNFTHKVQKHLRIKTYFRKFAYFCIINLQSTYGQSDDDAVRRK